jgi:hypothetical protein
MLLKYKLGIDNKIEIFLGTEMYVRFLQPLMIVYVKKVRLFYNGPMSEAQHCVLPFCSEIF